MTANVQTIKSNGPLPFSAAVRAGGFVFVSGQASVDETGNIVTDSFEGEMRRAMANLERILAECDLGLGDVVQVRAYIGTVEDVGPFNELYRDYFDEPYPARTTVAGCIGSLKFEIDAVALDKP